MIGQEYMIIAYEEEEREWKVEGEQGNGRARVFDIGPTYKICKENI